MKNKKKSCFLSSYCVHTTRDCLTYDMTNNLQVMKIPYIELLIILYLGPNERLITWRALTKLVFKQFIQCKQLAFRFSLTNRKISEGG